SCHVTLSPAAHRLHHQAESQLIPTTRAQNAGRRLSVLVRDFLLTRFAPRQGLVSLVPLLPPRQIRQTRVRFPPPPSSAQPSRFQSRSIETPSAGRLFSFAA